MTQNFGTLLIGPRQHGVVILGAGIAAALPGSPPWQWAPDVASAVTAAVSLGRLDLVHTHFTDQLFASRCDASAAQFLRIVTAVRDQCGAETAVTLHDIPYPGDDAARFTRRSAAYSTVIAACDGRVIVSSAHEAERVRAFSPSCTPIVIPLPISSSAQTEVMGAPDSEVTLLGFIYPGKGHADAIRASRALPAHIGVTALGRAADGHDALVGQLCQLSAEVGRRFTVTGFVVEPDFTRRLRSAAVPLAAHGDISASGSIASWQGAGRRPLVPDVPYTRELERRCPRSVVRYAPGELALAVALEGALDDPGSTWLDDTVVLSPNPAEVAELLGDALHHMRRRPVR